MNAHSSQAGFSLVELLVAATIFAFIVTGVTGLFIQALDIQRRAAGIAKIEENAQFVMESIAREVRVSAITTPDNDCSDLSSAGILDITHPTNGDITYEFIPGTVGAIERAGEVITSADVNFISFAFCVMGAAQLDQQSARLMMTATMESVAGRPSTRVKATVQTTVVSRDLASEFP